MAQEIKPDTPLSVLLHIYPDAESILKAHFKSADFTSITARVKTLEDISKEEEVDLQAVLNDLNEKLDT